MSNYKLYIKNLSGVWKIADIGDYSPSMNYQSNDFAELKSRQASYSQNLKLPQTPTNCNIFGYSNNFDVKTNAQYRKWDCRLYSNDYVLAGIGSFLKINKINNNFECQILSGTADFFTKLQEKSMEMLNLGEYVREEVPTLGIYDTYVIPEQTMLRGKKNTYYNEKGLPLPNVFVKKAMHAICNNSGYNLITDMDGIWDDYSTNICNLQQSDDSMNRYNAIAQKTEESNLPPPSQPFITLPVLSDGDGSLVRNTDYRYMKYSAKFKGSVNIRAIIHFHKRSSFDILTECRIYVMMNGFTANDETVASKIESIHTSSDSYTFQYEKEIDVSINDELYILIALKYQYQTTYTASIELNNIKVDQVPVGGKLYLSKNIGFEKQYDYFKAIVQSFCLTVFVDYVKNNVYLLTINKLYSNKQYALDWSGKIHNSTPEQTFTIGSYAQNNKILFEENTDDDVIDVGTFQIQDSTLELTKDIFTLPFESGIDYDVNKVVAWSPTDSGSEPIYQQASRANMPLFKIDENENFVFTQGKPHLLTKDSNILWYISQHLKANYIVDTFYPNLSKMLNNAKTLELTMNLTDEDIDMYNRINQDANCPYSFIPIYLSQFGSYFYVNKIKNFVSGKLTKCELVRL